MSRGTVESPTPDGTLARRLRARLVVRAGGCREWSGHVDRRTGYGKIANRPGPPIDVHVAAWIVGRGPVPPGLVVRHTCDNRVCAAVEHLALGTQADNVRDMVVRGRCNNVRDEVECPAGHPYDEADAEGFRGCSVC